MRALANQSKSKKISRLMLETCQTFHFTSLHYTLLDSLLSGYLALILTNGLSCVAAAFAARMCSMNESLEEVHPNASKAFATE